jgi:hypothetical protein
MILLYIMMALILLLSVPLDFHFGTQSKKPFFQFKICWGKLFCFTPSMDVNRPEKVEKPLKKHKKSKKSDKSFAKRFFTNKTVLKRLLQFLKEIWQALHWKSDGFYFEFGLDDPADTGELMGQLAPFTWMLPPTIQLQPNFQQEITYWEGEVSLRIYPIQIITTVVRLIFSPTLIKGIYAAKVAPSRS